MMHVGIVSTLSTNIGDDLVREGIVAIIRRVFPGRDLKFTIVNKHYPFEVYRAVNPLRALNPLFRGKARQFANRPLIRDTLSAAFSKLGGSRFSSCDLIVQSGAPVLWPRCYRSEWAKPLWEDVLGRLSSRIPVVNLAAGSCYPWEDQPESFRDPLDAAYAARILSCCRLTSTRDGLAQLLFGTVGSKVPLLPCTAFLVSLDHLASPDDQGLVLVNYMPGGGHYDWGQDIDRSAWRREVARLLDRLRGRHRVALLCHNKKEEEQARELDGDLPRIRPTSVAEYLEILPKVKAAVSNRLHACVALAGQGIPSIGIGTDTRLLMLSELDLPYFYVKQATAEAIEDKLEDAIHRRRTERERLLELRASTIERYVDLLAETLA